MALTIKPKEIDRTVPKGTKLDYKHHLLVGVSAESGGTLVLERWDFVPSAQDIQKAITGSKKSYVSYALASVCGLVAKD